MTAKLTLAAALCAAAFASAVPGGALAQTEDNAQARRRWNAAQDEQQQHARRRWNAANEDDAHARRRWNAANPPQPEARPHRPELTRPMVQRMQGGGGAGSGSRGR